jgi:hypothetical protein
MKTLSIVYFAALLFVFSCKEKINESIPNDKTKVELNSTPFFKNEVKTFNIPLSVWQRGYNLFGAGNGLAYLFSRDEKKVIGINITNGQETVLADFSGLLLTDFAFPVRIKNNEFILINGNKIHYTTSRNTSAELSLFVNNHLYALNPGFYNIPVYDELTNCIFLNINLDDEDFPDNFREFSTVGKIDLDNNKFSVINIPVPGNYKDDVSYGNLEDPKLNIIGRNLFVNFGLSTQTYVYNIDNESLTTKHIALPIKLTNASTLKQISQPTDLEDMLIKTHNIYSATNLNNGLLVLTKSGYTPSKPRFYDNVFVSYFNQNLTAEYHGNLNNETLRQYCDLIFLNSDSNTIYLQGLRKDKSTGQVNLDLVALNAASL